MTSLNQITDQMAAHGLPQLPSGHPVVDGKIKRFGKGKKAWYSLREFTLRSGKEAIVGAFGMWQGDEPNTVKVKLDWEGISDSERQELDRKMREAEQAEAEHKSKLAMRAANRAKMQMQAAGSDKFSECEYLQRKGITPENVLLNEDGVLLVPMFHFAPDGASAVAGVQKIHPNGDKTYNKGMNKIGAACLLGDVDTGTAVIAICEGYATGRSARMAQPDLPVAVAFDAGNLRHVAESLRGMFPDAHLLFLADDDFQLERRVHEWLERDYGVSVPELDFSGKECIYMPSLNAVPLHLTLHWRQDKNGIDYIEAHAIAGRSVRTRRFENAGVARSTQAAVELGNGSVIAPRFVDRGDRKWTDFNDLHVEQSLDDVREQITAALFDVKAQEKHDAAMEPPSHLHLAVDNENSPLPPEEKAGASAPSEGGGGGSKPKKEYGDEFWSTVNYLLDNFTLVYGEDYAWDAQKRILIRIANMRLAFSSDAVKFWLQNPDRKMVDKKNVVFDPALVDCEGYVNLFDGIKMQPKEGDCSHIMQLLSHLCGDNEDLATWVVCWLAYPLQNPGAKMRTSIIVHGDEGSGKNLFFENVVGKIYGEYAGVIGNAQIEGSFNEWASRKLFMVADEVVTRAELRQLKGRLKALVTGEVVRINAKMQSERDEANHMNFVFLSNELQPLALDKTDRRYLVLWTPPKRDESFYADVGKELKSGGIEAFYHFLLNVPLGDFNEHTKPPLNEAKENLISLGLTPPERFFREWRDGFLPLPFVCCSAQQLYSSYSRWCYLNGERFPGTQTSFGRNILRIGGGDGVRKAVIKYDLGSDEKQRTVYLVGAEPQDKSRKDWVEAASNNFETALNKYRPGGGLGPVGE